MLGRNLALLAVPVACFAGAGFAADGPNREPDWFKKPTPERLMALYPLEAMKKGLAGGAVIDCKVTVQGTLRDCAVVSEKPEGIGFGAAALALSPQFLMTPAVKNGQPVEGEVRIPINWKPTDGSSPPPLGSRIDVKPSKGSMVYSNLPYLEAPSHAQLLAAFPEKARAAGASGTVSLNCKIRDAGRLGNCDTVREEPAGLGFAAAGKSLAATFVVPAAKPDGESLVGAHTIVLLTFDGKALQQTSHVIGRPKWMAVPQVNDITAVMPPKARAAKVFKARVQMVCSVIAGGRVDSCAVEAEEPLGLGWGEAAVKLAPYFRLSVWTEEGLPTVGGRVKIPLRFDLPDPDAPAAQP
jgi:TonB family protein